MLDVRLNFAKFLNLVRRAHTPYVLNLRTIFNLPTSTSRESIDFVNALKGQIESEGIIIRYYNFILSDYKNLCNCTPHQISLPASAI
jgi:hypothetical protein